MSKLSYQNEFKCYVKDLWDEEFKQKAREKVCKHLLLYLHEDENFYCILHYPSEEKSLVFDKALNSIKSGKELNFFGVWFPKTVDKTIFNLSEGFFDDKELVENTEIDFRGATFTKNVVFNRIEFKVQPQFYDADFLGIVEFRETVFSNGVNFGKAKFRNEIYFPEARFNKEEKYNKANFAYSVFSGSVYFYRAFFANADFSDAEFNGPANFDNTEFNNAVFSRAKFNSDAKFSQVEFPNAQILQERNCYGELEDFSHEVNFNSCNFAGEVVFFDAKFGRDNCEKMTINRDAKINFSKTCFERDADFSNSKFSTKVDFNKAEFSAGIKFNKAEFSDEASFYTTSFNAETYFEKVRFVKMANFDSAKFLESSKVFFKNTKFHDEVKFKNTEFAGYVLFKFDKEGVVEKKERHENEKKERELFFSESFLIFQDARLKNPARVSFNGIRLEPNWFVNTNVSEFDFTACEWESSNKKLSVKTEIEKVGSRKDSHGKIRYIISYKILTRAFRQLAENAEKNNRFEEASGFRRMAFECEWIEKKEKISNWIKNLVPESEKLKRRFSGSTNEEDKPIPPTNSFGILRRSGDFFIHGLYRITSFYGESWSWALGVLLSLILVIFPTIYTQIDFQTCSKDRAIAASLAVCESKDEAVRENCTCNKDRISFTDAIVQSLTTATLQNVEYRKPLTGWGEVWIILEKIFAPLQSALLALAIRRKFMR